MRKNIAIFFAAALLLAGQGGAFGAEEKPLAKLAAVIDDLRQGGFVIYLRHATTGTAPVEAEDVTRCETQRNLSAQGRSEAVQIGKSMQALRIPIGRVISSPFCRTKDTAQLAFGRYVEDPDLGFLISSDASETKRLAASLRRMLATPPEKGSNTVLVSHSANLFEAAGMFAKPEGVAYVVKPLADGRFELLAKVLPDEWGDAAKLGEGRGASRR